MKKVRYEENRKKEDKTSIYQKENSIFARSFLMKTNNINIITHETI